MSLRHALLGLLAQRPASGYDLLKRFNTSLAFVWPAKQSQIYGELARLDDAELIIVTETGARNRKEYSITPAGREELHRWLTESEPEWAFRNEALLRVFFLWTLSPPEAAAYLKDFAERVGQRHRALELIRDEVDWDDSEANRYAHIILEYGLRGSQAMEEWARWAAQMAIDSATPI